MERKVDVRDKRKDKYIKSYEEFMMIERNIGKNIGSK
jgi:hypothetical protein